MRIENINTAIELAGEFIRAAERAKSRQWQVEQELHEWRERSYGKQEDGVCAPKDVGYTKESGQLRRTSLDLTRTLAEMRKP
jgi:hypothetical protein